MNKSPYRVVAGLLLVMLVSSACSVFSGGGKGRDSVSDDMMLTPFSTRHRYVTTADQLPLQMRVAWVDMAWGRHPRHSMTVGLLRPDDGLFRRETKPVQMRSIQHLVDAMDEYIDHMPIGILVTLDGKLPSEQVQPEAFGSFVSELQQALEKEGIVFFYILPNELHIID
jgi:hypothetical protein